MQVPRDVPGYHDVIKKPRCLEQIQRNLSKGRCWSGGGGPMCAQFICRSHRCSSVPTPCSQVP